MTATITVCITFHLPEERQAAEEFERKHRQYEWVKGQSDDEICFKYEQSQAMGGEHG